MNYLDGNFDELEPRPLPKPAVLLRIADPSVPEVSIIAGTRFNVAKPSPKKRDKSEVPLEAYSKWRNNKSPLSTDPCVVTQRPLKWQPHANDFILRNKVSKNFSATEIGQPSRGVDETLKPSFNRHQNPNNSPHNHSLVTTRNISDDQHFPNCSSVQGRTTAVTFSQSDALRGQMQNNSYNTIKSILKSSLSNGSSVGSSKSDVRCEFRETDLPDFDQHENQRHIDRSPRLRSPPLSQRHHERETNREADTVRDLLLVVQNQNEQIKSLQTQVERLLERHEHNMGYVESRDVAGKSKDNCPSPGHENNSHYRKDVSSQTRGINVSSDRSNEPHSEVSSSHRKDPLMSAIMEKKVSIGVMTSFEFSVQNNPFVSDTNSPIIFRDCEKNASSTNEIRRGNGAFSAKAAPGPLENISEDTESHPSSIWKQNDDNNRSPYHTDFIADKNRQYTENRSPIPHRIRSNVVDSSVLLLNKESQTSVAIDESRSCKDPGVHDWLDERDAGSADPLVTSSKNVPKEMHPDNANRTDRANRVEGNRDRTNFRYSGQMDREKRSIPRENTADGSFALCSSDVQVPESPLPSLDPSIHVDMREYSSDDENEDSKYTPAVGWTFYKNVVGQVNRMLHNVPNSKDIGDGNKINPLAFHTDIVGNKDILNSVRSATIGQLKMLGIGYAEHSQVNGEPGQKKVTFDSSYCPPMDYQTNVCPPTNSIIESNTSMHMRTLALKYLSDEQLADLAVSQQGLAATMKHKLFSIQGTNMSFATMNYLQRYCLVSGAPTLNTEGRGQNSPVCQRKAKHVFTKQEIIARPSARNGTLENSMSKGTSDNILDMTTLKQQPKLL